jgi:hypothetical protein
VDGAELRGRREPDERTGQMTTSFLVKY